jgi:hypothetical protein
MSEDVADVYPAQIVSHIDDQSVFVSTYVENRPPFSEETGRDKILSNLVRAGIVFQPNDREPGPQRTLGIGMRLPEFL